MTDREAIEYAENELESTGYTLETNNKLRGGLFKILSTKFEFLVTAKSALQERENPQPLTLEDLRGMDGEWVWAISSDPDLTVSAWAYIVASQAHTLWEYKPDRLLGNVQLDFENYGKTWLAYRSKPKEENT